MEMTDEGVLGGYSNGTFNPKGTMTRGEFAKVLATLVGCELTNEPSQYSDVNDHWARSYIVAVGDVMGGTSTTQFEPDRPVTREVVVAALGNLCGWMVPATDASDGSALFSDFNQISPELQDGVLRAVALGITSGYPDGTFQPKGELKRSEACVLAYRAFHYEIDTVAANLGEFRSLIITNDGTVYYIDGDTIYNTKNDKTLKLNRDFGGVQFELSFAWGQYFYNTYLGNH